VCGIIDKLHTMRNFWCERWALFSKRAIAPSIPRCCVDVTREREPPLYLAVDYDESDPDDETLEDCKCSLCQRRFEEQGNWLCAAPVSSHLSPIQNDQSSSQTNRGSRVCFLALSGCLETPPFSDGSALVCCPTTATCSSLGTTYLRS
jgi:hypothetical protein